MNEIVLGGDGKTEMKISQVTETTLKSTRRHISAAPLPCINGHRQKRTSWLDILSARLTL